MDGKKGLVPLKWSTHEDTFSQPWSYSDDGSGKQQKRPALERKASPHRGIVDSMDGSEQSSDGYIKWSLTNGDVPKYPSQDEKIQQPKNYTFDELEDDFKDRSQRQFHRDLPKRIRSFDEKYRGSHEFSRSYKDEITQDDPRIHTNTRDDPSVYDYTREYPRVFTNNQEQRMSAGTRGHNKNHTRSRGHPKQYSYEIENRAFEDLLQGGRSIEVSSTRIKLK